MWGVLTPGIKLWVFGGPKRLQVFTFGRVSFIFTLASKWGYDILRNPLEKHHLKFFMNNWLYQNPTFKEHKKQQLGYTIFQRCLVPLNATLVYDSKGLGCNYCNPLCVEGGAGVETLANIFSCCQNNTHTIKNISATKLNKISWRNIEWNV